MEDLLVMRKEVEVVSFHAVLLLYVDRHHPMRFELEPFPLVHEIAIDS